ncbi:MAG: hypothetical protein AAFX06_09465 [Planctomycetota bacterium]
MLRGVVVRGWTKKGAGVGAIGLVVIGVVVIGVAAGGTICIGAGVGCPTPIGSVVHPPSQPESKAESHPPSLHRQPAVPQESSPKTCSIPPATVSRVLKTTVFLRFIRSGFLLVFPQPQAFAGAESQ